jgi:hypothetical protein
MNIDQQIMAFVVIIGILVLLGLVLVGVVYFYLFKSFMQNREFYLPQWVEKLIDFIDGR